MARYSRSTEENFDGFLKAVANSPYSNNAIQEFTNYKTANDNAMSLGMTNCVGGKPCITQEFNTVYDDVKNTKLTITLQCVLLDSGYYGSVEAHYFLSSPKFPTPITAMLQLGKEQIHLTGSVFARFHIDEMYKHIVDYFTKRDRSWTGSRMSYMRQYAERNNVGPVNKLLYDVAVARRKKYKKQYPSGMSEVIDNNEALIVSTQNSKDYKFPDYTTIKLTPYDTSNSHTIQQIIKDEKEDIAKGNVLANVSETYEFYNRFGNGSHSTKLVRDEGYRHISTLAHLGVIDVVDRQVTWQNKELKELYDKKNNGITDYFRNTEGWRLSGYSLRDALVSFQLVTLNNQVYNLHFGGGYSSDENMMNMMEVLKRENLLPELYKRLSKYITEDMKVDLSEQLLKEGKVREDREGRLSIRDLLSNI